MGDGTIRDNVTCLIWQKGNLTFGLDEHAYASRTRKRLARLRPSHAAERWRTATRVELPVD